MPDDQRASTMGPAIFFGLLVYSLATYAPPDVTYANPADTNSLDVAIGVVAVDVQSASNLTPISTPSTRHAVRRSSVGIQIKQQNPEQPFGTDALHHPPISVGFVGQSLPVSPVYIPAVIHAPPPDARLEYREPVGLLEQAAASNALLPESNVPKDVDGDFVGEATMQTDNDFALDVPRLAGFSDHSPLTLKASLAAPYVSPLPPDSPMAELKAVAVSGDNVHLREGPGVRFAILGKVPLGASVQVLGSLGNWRRVLLSDDAQQFSGWMYVDYVPDAPN